MLDKKRLPHKRQPFQYIMRIYYLVKVTFEVNTSSLILTLTKYTQLVSLDKSTSKDCAEVLFKFLK